MTVDWERYQKCPVCFAKLAKPCVERTWARADGIPVVETENEAAEPHSTRKPRAGREAE